MLALAPKIVSSDEEEDAETVEAVFAQARNAEVSAEEYLVDDGWRVVGVEPEAIAANGNGHHDEAPEPQQSLFSWAEFMAEEPGPQASARNRVPVRVGDEQGAGERGRTGWRRALITTSRGGHHNVWRPPLLVHVCVLFVARNCPIPPVRTVWTPVQ